MLSRLNGEFRQLKNKYSHVRQFLNSSSYRSSHTNTNSGINDAKNTDILGLIVFASISLGTAGLGIWQFKRYFWKVQMIEDEQASMRLPPIEFDKTKIVSQIELDEYLSNNKGRRLNITGKYDHSKEVLLGPRSPLIGMLKDSAQGMATNPQVS